MKKIMLSLAILSLALFVAAPAPISAAPLADGLVGYWNMDDGGGTNANEPVNNLDGTLTNGPSWVPGGPLGGTVVGSTASLSFDGVDDYVEVTDNSELDLTSAITVAGWIEVNSGATDPGTVAAKWNDLTGNLRGYLLTVHTNETPRFYISTTGADFPSAVGSALSDGWHYL